MENLEIESGAQSFFQAPVRELCFPRAQVVRVCVCMPLVIAAAGATAVGHWLYKAHGVPGSEPASQSPQLAFYLKFKSSSGAHFDKNLDDVGLRLPGVDPADLLDGMTVREYCGKPDSALLEELDGEGFDVVVSPRGNPCMQREMELTSLNPEIPGDRAAQDREKAEEIKDRRAGFFVYSGCVYHLPPTFAIICHDGNKAAAYVDGARQNLTKDQYLKPGFFLKAEEGEDNYRGIDPKHPPNYLWVMDRDGNILFERENQQHWEVLPYAEAKYLTEEQRVSMREHRTFIHRQHRVPQHGDLVAAMELVGPGTRGGVYRGIGRGGGSLRFDKKKGKVVVDNKSSFAQLRIALGCDVLSTCTNEQDFRYTGFGRCKMDIAKELQRLSEMGVGDDVPSCYRKAATYTPNLERQLVRMGVLTSDHFQHIEFKNVPETDFYEELYWKTFYDQVRFESLYNRTGPASDLWRQFADTPRWGAMCTGC